MGTRGRYLLEELVGTVLFSKTLEKEFDCEGSWLIDVPCQSLIVSFIIIVYVVLRHTYSMHTSTHICTHYTGLHLENDSGGGGSISICLCTL